MLSGAKVLLMANVRLATGLPDSVVSAGADIAALIGHSDRMCGFWAIDRTSSRSSTPAKLLAYAQQPAATSSAAGNTVRVTFEPICGLCASRRIVSCD